MHHMKSGRRLGRDSAQRKSLFRNMITSLLLHGRIRTTEGKGREIVRMADRVITLGKKAAVSAAAGSPSGAVHSIRMARRFVVDRQALSLLTGKYAAHFAERQGGYTRLLKAGIRPGDNAPMVIVELVGVVVVAPLDGSAAAEVAVEA
jgi:large subunit ribosomal protein L17